MCVYTHSMDPDHFSDSCREILTIAFNFSKHELMSIQKAVVPQRWMATLNWKWALISIHESCIHSLTKGWRIHFSPQHCLLPLCMLLSHISPQLRMKCGDWQGFYGGLLWHQGVCFFWVECETVLMIYDWCLFTTTCKNILINLKHVWVLVPLAKIGRGVKVCHSCGWKYINHQAFNICANQKNKLPKLQATLVGNYDSPTHRGEV